MTAVLDTGASFVFLRTWTLSLHSLITCQVSDDKSPVRLITDTLKVTWQFCHVPIRIYSLYFTYILLLKVWWLYVIMLSFLNFNIFLLIELYVHVLTMTIFFFSLWIFYSKLFDNNWSSLFMGSAYTCLSMHQDLLVLQDQYLCFCTIHAALQGGERPEPLCGCSWV